MPQQNMLDEVASDLALWIDQISTQVAVAFAANHAPFSVTVTEEQKLEYYRSRLFNPDGSPNAVGREAEMQRLGVSGFVQVYRALIKRYPELQIPTPPAIEVPDEWPGAPGGPPGAPAAPPGLPGGPPPGPGGSPALSVGPPGAARPRPPILPPGR